MGCRSSEVKIVKANCRLSDSPSATGPPVSGYLYPLDRLDTRLCTIVHNTEYELWYRLTIGWAGTIWSGRCTVYNNKAIRKCFAYTSSRQTVDLTIYFINYVLYEKIHLYQHVAHTICILYTPIITMLEVLSVYFCKHTNYFPGFHVWSVP